jgi:hypothetical protein
VKGGEEEKQQQQQQQQTNKIGREGKRRLKDMNSSAFNT